MCASAARLARLTSRSVATPLIDPGPGSPRRLAAPRRDYRAIDGGGHASPPTTRRPVAPFFAPWRRDKGLGGGGRGRSRCWVPGFGSSPHGSASLRRLGGAGRSCPPAPNWPRAPVSTDRAGGLPRRPCAPAREPGFRIEVTAPRGLHRRHYTARGGALPATRISVSECLRPTMRLPKHLTPAVPVSCGSGARGASLVHWTCRRRMGGH
jgi:hypothetical protein